MVAETRRARTAHEALALFPQFGADFVLTDIVMPGGMNGLDLAQRLRDQVADLPILLTTGYSAAAQDAAKLSFPTLKKPYRAHQLTEAIVETVRGTKSRGH